MRALVVLALVLVGPAATWRPPVTGPLVRGFEAPACVWCAGHRGLRFATVPGQRVIAPTAGTVRFAGTVAGRRWVTMEVIDGRRVTVGPLASVAVTAGQVVGEGTALGRASTWVLLSVRTRDGTYVDPAPLLRRPAVRPRLVPLGTIAG